MAPGRYPQPTSVERVEMSVVLCHESALRYWLTKTSHEAIPPVSTCQSLAFSSANMRDVRGDALPFGYATKRPLHVLVNDSDSVRNQRSLIVHRWRGGLPPGSFCELSGSNLVSSPEFTFLQMAAGQSLREAVEIGDYLCGLFSIGDSGRGYTGQRDALATPESTAGFLDQVPGAYGVKQALRALRCIVARTASPREIMLCSALVLPKSGGGRAIRHVVANQEVKIPERLWEFAGTDSFYCDVYIPRAHGDVEYDSEQYHTGRYRLDHTQKRRNILEVSGIKTMSATPGQLSTFEYFQNFMWMLNKRFGLRERSLTEAQIDARRDLYEFFNDPRRTLF